MHDDSRGRVRVHGAGLVADLGAIDRRDVKVWGGKGATLAALAGLEGIRVPGGFCVSTEAFRRVVGMDPGINALIERLGQLQPGDRDAIRALARAIRAAVCAAEVPADIAGAVGSAVARLGATVACAVRSSATAEDTPWASFAGQHDSYLGVTGEASVLRHIRRCWASLFTERAIAYRARRGVDHREVQMAVVVQRLAPAHASGVLFTAEPVNGNRRVSVVEAVHGPGDALAAGRTDANRYTVRDGRVVERTSARGRPARAAEADGGLAPPAADDRPVLTDAQAVELACIGRRIEAHLEAPQDIEWCLGEGAFHIVQSRPITTLYPVPDPGRDDRRVFLSVGHQQMMTDPMKPLGWSLFQLTAGRPMYEAGGRLFVDPTRELTSAPGPEVLLALLARSEPLMMDALRTLLERGDFLPSPPAEGAGPRSEAGHTRSGPSPTLAAPDPQLDDDPAIVADLIAASRASVDALERGIRGKRGPLLLDFIEEDVQRLKQHLREPRSHAVLMAGLNASAWINDQMSAWLGETNAADTLSLSVPHNVTTEMGLALLDVADAVRPHGEVIDHLQRATDRDFLEGLLPLPGGRVVHDLLVAFLDTHGVRCAGEIDVTRPRWRESPTALVPLILGNVRAFEPGERARRQDQGRRRAAARERELLARLGRLPGGEIKALEARRMIRRLRACIGYREHPKFHIVSRYFCYRQALLEEAGRLVGAGLLNEPEDIYYLTFAELRDALEGRSLDGDPIARRGREHARNLELTPPRVITSEGEVVAGAYRRRDLPEGTLSGLPVSTGVVEGRARVVLDLADATLAPGDILVTTYTDPSWTPLFLTIRGLVTEVGGLMTHGVVIARELGLPAVVGVERATARIADGQRIRVHGTEGYVELLPTEPQAER